MGQQISVSTLRTVQEALIMVYQANVVWLQIHQREQEFKDAMDEIGAALKIETEDQEGTSGQQ